MSKVKEIPEQLYVEVGGDNLLTRELPPVSQCTQPQGLPKGEESTQMVSRVLLAIEDDCEDSRMEAKVSGEALIDEEEGYAADELWRRGWP